MADHDRGSYRVYNYVVEYILNLLKYTRILCVVLHDTFLSQLLYIACMTVYSVLPFEWLSGYSQPIKVWPLYLYMVAFFGHALGYAHRFYNVRLETM